MDGVRQWAKRIAAGYAIGVGAVAPGLSGGAIAVVFGVYQRITDALAHFFGNIQRNLLFLLPLGLGGVLGVMSLGRVLEYCFAQYPVVTKAVFLGLMAGTLPSIFKSAGREGTKGWYWLLTAAAFGGGWWLFVGIGGATAVQTLSFGQAVLCGAVLGFGTVVPGVSSSCLLLSMGYYEAVLEVVGGRYMAGLLPLGLGFGISALLLIRVVDVLYKRAYGAMSYTVLGLVLSSMVPVVPPLSVDRGSCLLLLLMMLCAGLSYAAMRWMTAKAG